MSLNHIEVKEIYLKNDFELSTISLIITSVIILYFREL